MQPTQPAYKAWYKTAAWQKLRARQLYQHPLCVMCAQERRTTAATICDHITPHKGDHHAFWHGPFQSLCKPHHDGAKQSVEKGGKPRQAIAADGWPLTGS